MCLTVPHVSAAVAPDDIRRAAADKRRGLRHVHPQVSMAHAHRAGVQWSSLCGGVGDVHQARYAPSITVKIHHVTLRSDQTQNLT